MDLAPLHARLRLAIAPGLGPVLTRRLEERLGGPVAVCEASADQLRRVDGIGSKRADLIRRAIRDADLDAELRHVERLGVRLVAIDDAGYPALLRHIPDPPPLLYMRGEVQRGDALALAIVGARRCTSYGREQADRLAALCAQAGLTIVSGGARGIDAAAHRAALRIGGRTIVVLGSGLAKPYPAEHADLFDQIADGRGAVLSELPMTAPPIAENFPRRNRIISGLSLGVLVAEAALRSGALITARLASEEHHREVLALPGRADSPNSAGCHKIIRESWATLVTGPADILDALGEAGQTLKAALAFQPDGDREPTGDGEAAPSADGALDAEARTLLAAITADPTSIDDLCRATDLPVASIQSRLTQLQIVGLIERLPANRVKRRPTA